MEKHFEQLQRTLGTNVKRARKGAGLSQEDLAFEAEIDRTYVSQLERGLINPSLLVLWKVSKALNCNLIDLFVKSRG